MSMTHIAGLFRSAAIYKFTRVDALYRARAFPGVLRRVRFLDAFAAVNQSSRRGTLR